MMFRRKATRPIGAPFPGARPFEPRDALPKHLRNFYDVYDHKFLALLEAKFDAWVGERAALGDRRWAELTQQATDHQARVDAALKTVSDAVSGAERFTSDFSARTEKMEAAVKSLYGPANPPPPTVAADPTLLARLKELEDRLLLLEEDGGGIPPEETPPPPVQTRRPRARREEIPPEDGCCDGEFRDCCGRHESGAGPGGRREKRNRPNVPYFAEDDPTPTPKKEPPAPKSIYPAAETMLDEIPEGKHLNIPRFLWTLIDQEGAVNRNRLAECFKHRGLRPGLADIEDAAKSLNLAVRKNREQESVYSVGPESKPPG